MSRFAGSSIAFLCALLVGLGLYFRFMPGAPDPRLPRGADFRLQSSAGLVDSKALRGQVLVLYFGYSHCPDICPTTLASGGKALQLLSPDERQRVRYFMISVDPERDTPQQLQEYTAFFHPSMQGLTGNNADIAALSRAFGAGYVKQAGKEAGLYTVDHTTSTHIVNRDGQLVAILPMNTSPEDLAATIRKLL